MGALIGGYRLAGPFPANGGDVASLPPSYSDDQSWSLLFKKKSHSGTRNASG